jgi:uncharacterized protein YjbJ (UPF0337 family)
MSWEDVERNWLKYQDRVRQRWEKLTHYDLQLIDGKRDQLAGMILARYGLTHGEIEQQLDEFQTER